MQGNEKSAGKSQKKSWFQGLQSEFRKMSGQTAMN